MNNNTQEHKKSLEAYAKTAKTFDLLDIAPAIPFVLGNIIKYTLRAPYKGQKESDMAKARDYYSVIINNCDVYSECREWYCYNLGTMRLIRKLYGEDVYKDTDSKACTLDKFCERVLDL